MRYATVLSVLLLVLSIGLTDVEAQNDRSIVEYPDGNVSLAAVVPGQPFDSTVFAYWHLEVDDPAPLDHDISIHQIGTFNEFQQALWLDFIDIHANGAFHFDVFQSNDGVNFEFVQELVLGGS
jgi:hypothetical protein